MILQLLFCFGVGAYVIRFALLTYANPERIRERWFSKLPQRGWSLRLLRAVSVFWVFGGCMVVSQGLTTLPVFQQHHGTNMLLIVVAGAVIVTAVLVSTRRVSRLKTQ